MATIPKNVQTNLHSSLKIHKSVYDNLPVWYHVLADFFTEEGRVEIIPDDSSEMEVLHG